MCVNDAIVRITETPLSLLTDITQPNSNAAPPPRLTDTTTRLLQPRHCVRRSGHCLCGGMVDNVANLCPNHDPTLLLCDLSFSQSTRQAGVLVWWLAGWVGGWWGSSILPGTGRGNVTCRFVTRVTSPWWSWVDTWTGYFHNTQPERQLHHHFSTYSEYHSGFPFFSVTVLTVLLPARSQDKSTICTEKSFVPDNSWSKLSSLLHHRKTFLEAGLLFTWNTISSSEWSDETKQLSDLWDQLFLR